MWRGRSRLELGIRIIPLSFAKMRIREPIQSGVAFLERRHLLFGSGSTLCPRTRNVQPFLLQP